MALCVANDAAGDENIPTILYFHGSGGQWNQFHTGAGWVGIREWLLDNGCAIIEGTGGPDAASGANNWGNAASRAAYAAYLAEADSRIDIGPLVAFGRSMGGLPSIWAYLSSPYASRCVGLIGSSTVCTLWAGTPGGGALQRPTGEAFGQVILDAYGASSVSDLRTRTVGFAPEDYTPSLWNGTRVLQLVGTADTAVPPETRGAYPLRAIYAPRVSVDRLAIKDGGDHDVPNGTFGMTTDMQAFLSPLGYGPPPVVDPRRWDVTSAWVRTSGGTQKLAVSVKT